MMLKMPMRRMPTRRKGMRAWKGIPERVRLPLQGGVRARQERDFQ